MENDQSEYIKELEDCIKNLMGVFDTPVARFKISTPLIEETREIGRYVIQKIKARNNEQDEN